MKAFITQQPNKGRLVHMLCEQAVHAVRASKDFDTHGELCKMFPPADVAEIAEGFDRWLEGVKPDLMRADAVETELRLGVSKGETMLQPCAFDDVNCLLHGVIDRMDFYPQRIVIHDYKTGWGNHDTLQGLIYSILAFVAYPDVESVAVVFSNPIRGYISDAYEIERASQAEAVALFKTIGHIRLLLAEPCALSYSSLSHYYRCPASFLHYKGLPTNDAFMTTPNRYCHYCKGCDICEAWHDDTSSLTSGLQAKHIASRLITAKALVGKWTDMLKAYTEVNDTQVVIDHTVFGWQTSDPRLKVRNMPAFIEMLTTSRLFDDDGQPLEFDVAKVLTIKPNKTSEAAVRAFAFESPDDAEISSGPLRFNQFSEKECDE